jgi:DNA polymerase III alpha subunit
MKNSFSDARYYWDSRHQTSSRHQFAILKSHISSFTEQDWLDLKATADDIVVKSKNIEIKHNYHLPTIDIPKHIKLKSDSYDKQLYYVLMEKIKEHGRWNGSQEYIERFKKEIDVIWKNDTMNFLPYFLLYEDIGSYARSVGILQGLARGSAGGCLLSYYLKITHIDPVARNLPFERFLSHARIRANSFPDIDADFGNRGPIIKYLQTKYKLGFAQIGTFQKMKVKSAIKHAMYALYGRAENDPEIKALCDLIPDSPQGLDEFKFVYGYTDSEEVTHKGVVDTTPQLLNFFAQYQDCESLVKKLLGLPASVGRHPSAFVISTLDLSDGRVPTFITEDEEIGMVQSVQFDGPMCEKSGLVKADILGVTTIQTISDCMGKIKKTHGVDLWEEDSMGVAAVYRLPEDPAVFKDFYERKTDSSFQFNTDLIKGMVKDFAPTSIDELSDFTALARPGALDMEALPGVSATQLYIDVKNGRRDPHYIHPDLEPILKSTKSVCCYQENLMEMLVKFGGYTLEESDQIRAAIAKKKRDVIVSAFSKIKASTSKMGWTEEQADGLCQILEAYSRYSFNKSHSAAYAQLGYITMWLKHHYPLEWWSSELNLSGEDKLRKYMGVIGHIVSNPSMKRPSVDWEIIGDKIAAPLTSIKGMGKKQILELASSAPYESFEELVNTVESKYFHVGHFMACLKARALDSFMDPDLPYVQERKRIIDCFFESRGKDPRFIKDQHKRKDALAQNKRNAQYMIELTEADPFKMFLMEKEVSKVFSKTLLDDDLVKKALMTMMPALTTTRSKMVPLMMNGTRVIRSIGCMEKLLESGLVDKEKYYGIFLFQSSSTASGISKKSGKPWSRVEIELSDGVRTIYASQWDKDKALGWQTNVPVIVHGEVRLDWRGRPSFNVKSIEKISSIGRRR